MEVFGPLQILHVGRVPVELLEITPSNVALVGLAEDGLGLQVPDDNFFI